MSMGMDSMFEDPLHEVKRPANWTEIVSNYDGPYKFHADMMMYSETPSGHAKIGQSTKGSSALKRKNEDERPSLPNRMRNFSWSRNEARRGTACLEAA